MSVNPDQFYFGGQYEAGPVTDKVWFRPNLNIGFGDNVTLVSVNLELVYYFSTTQLKDWKVYAGGGPAINLYDFPDLGPGIDTSDVQPGFNFLVGIAHKKGLFVEFKVGVLDSPDVRFGFGYKFRKK